MNLVASVLHLDRAAIKALRVTDPYSIHRVVYSLYEDVRSEQAKDASQTSGILFADQGGDFHGRRILMLADRAPTARVDGQHGHVQSKSIADGFLDREQYQFKVIVNPTRRDNASRKLVPVKGHEAIAEWFQQRAAQSWGFQVSSEHLQVERVDVLQFKDKQLHPVTLTQAHVQGRLQVTDRARFRDSFSGGIGRGRAFGCGLLQIIPVIDNPFA